MASINTSSPPYTPKQAAARAKEAPKGHASGVGSSTSNWGSGGRAKRSNPASGPAHGRVSMAKKHPGFKAVQSKIAKRQGVSEERAGAMLAAGTRRASAGAKRRNPRLKRVKG